MFGPSEETQVVFSLLVIAFYPPIRREYQVDSPAQYIRRLAAAFSTSEGQLPEWNVLKYGLQAMVLDLSIQICMSSGVYMAAHMGLPSLYQISAMQAALPQYGTAVAAGISYAMKIVGAVMLGRGFYSAFRLFAGLCVMGSAIFAAIAFLTTSPFREPLAFGYAAQACIYASDPGCTEMYASIFGSGAAQQGTSLALTFER